MFRLGVMLFDDHLLVRGVLSSRRIPRSDVLSVRDDCFIDWRRTKAEGSHSTPITAFMTTAGTDESGFGPELARNSMRQIRVWVEKA